MALKVKALKTVGATTTNNPDTLIRQNTDDEIIKNISDCDSETIRYSEWTRKEVEHRDEMTKRMQIETVVKSKRDFVEMFNKI